MKEMVMTFTKIVLRACIALGGASLWVSPARATVFTFNADPFAGSTALQTPGRQIVGNEISIPVFDFANDSLAFTSPAFGISGGIQLWNGPADTIPPGGANFIVLRTFDSDAVTPGNQLNAGTAANLIASQITTPGSGFFIYFNSGLDLPRLVYSADLDSNQADLKILARFTGLAGAAGRDELARFTADNIAAVPEPGSWAMLMVGFGMVGTLVRRRGAARARPQSASAPVPR
jgi:hypothetical protein